MGVVHGGVHWCRAMRGCVRKARGACWLVHTGSCGGGSGRRGAGAGVRPVHGLSSHSCISGSGEGEKNVSIPCLSHETVGLWLCKDATVKHVHGRATEAKLESCLE